MKIPFLHDHSLSPCSCAGDAVPRTECRGVRIRHRELLHQLVPARHQIQSEQPHWVTPLVTVTPRLEEEYRYDQFFQSMRDGVWTNNFGGGKGVELIPFQNTEVIVGVPAYSESQHADAIATAGPTGRSW